MRVADVLQDGFDRVHGVVHRVVDGLGPHELGARLDGQSNSIAWLIWHLTRIQDDHVAHVAGAGQVWTTHGWHDRFHLPFDTTATGYGHGPDEVAAVQVESGELLIGYFDDVHQKTRQFVQTLSEADLDRVVDRSWTPPVTLGVRLVSVLSDDLQHAGQAALIRGIVRAG